MYYQPVRYRQVYIVGSGSFLPGPAVDNDAMDAYIAPLNRQSARIKRRILGENGIQSRHYAIDAAGQRRYTAAEMAKHAIQAALDDAAVQLPDVTLLAAATSGGDLAMPGFASQVHGSLAAPPLEARSHAGICAAGVAALKDAANLVERGEHTRAAVVAVEFPSRLFRRSRYAPADYQVDFDAHFLRWMLSDGAGACIVANRPQSPRGLALRLEWIHLKSFAGDYPTCMQVGAPQHQPDTSYLDYDTLAAAEAAGAFLLRQDIRLLPQLFDVATHEYAALVSAGLVNPAQVDHFLCHYSSASLGEVCDELMQRAGLGIPRERWFSNLTTCGNTGSASIYIMLAEFMRTRALRPGQQIFCFVPESGRFTVGYLLLTVVAADRADSGADPVDAPHAPQDADPLVQTLLQDLAAVWHDYRSAVWRTPLVAAIRDGHFTVADYQRWTAAWVPQVREGSCWMRGALAQLSPPYAALRTLIEQHASEEQNDFRILFEDYRAAGGSVADIDQLRRTPGGAALSAYLHAQAELPDAVGLLGAIYIIEGTGQRIVPALLPLLRRQLPLPPECFRFLAYHGDNDAHHLARWLSALRLVLAVSPDPTQAAQAIVTTAKRVAQLYRLQWEDVLQ